MLCEIKAGSHQRMVELGDGDEAAEVSVSRFPVSFLVAARLISPRPSYSYEREINQAQRSCIKRIQEQDSPAGLPMVLCVSQLRWDDPPELDDGSIPSGDLVIVGLELTDGWYRIRANVDEALKSACERGKIVVGSKLALSGARVSFRCFELPVQSSSRARRTDRQLARGHRRTRGAWSLHCRFDPFLTV